MKTAILISASLSPQSLSEKLILKTEEKLKSKNIKTQVINLKDETIPFCDGRKLEAYPPQMTQIYQKIENADFAIFGMPIYCYSVSGPLKNFIDIFSRAFTNKPFGICSAAGTKMSYLAQADLMKILSFESKSVPIQPTVLVDGSDFSPTGEMNEKVLERMDQMIEKLIQ